MKKNDECLKKAEKELEEDRTAYLNGQVEIERSQKHISILIETIDDLIFQRDCARQEAHAIAAKFEERKTTIGFC